MTRQELREALRLPGGERFGDVMAPFQRAFFTALDSAETRHFYAERPRGAAKSSDLSAEAVVELLFGPPAGRLFVVACDKDQAGIVAELARGWALRTGLGSALRVERWKLIVPKKDAVLEVLAADAPGAYGRLPTWIGCDELSQWPDGYGEEMWTAMWSSAPKRRARVICISTPGWDKGGLAYKIRELARTSPHWHFSSLQEPAPWIDESWLMEQRATLPTHTFERLHMGRWVEGVGAFLAESEVANVFTEDLPSGGGAVAIGCDLGVSRDAAVIAQVRADPSGAVVVDRLLVHSPRRTEKVDLMDVEDDLAALASAARAPIILDPWNGALLSQRLRQRGVPVEEYMFSKEARDKLFTTLLSLVREGRLRSRPDARLKRELLGLEVTEAASGFRVAHPRGQHDDTVVAVALGAQKVAGSGAALAPERFNDLVILGSRRESADMPWQTTGRPPWEL